MAASCIATLPRHTHALSMKVILVMLALLAGQAEGFEISNRHLNFDTCYNNSIKTLNNTDRNDKRLCFKYDITGAPRIDTNKTLINLEGCIDLCGHGFEYYSPSDIAFRVTLFLVPLLSLAARVGWAPTGVVNVFWTIIHLLGDPVDSLWSTLTRQEKARRNYHTALEIAPGAAREVAAIWTAYDLWWQDPVTHFEDELKRRSNTRRARTVNDVVSLDRSSTVHHSSRGVEQYSVPALLKKKETYHIKRASFALAGNRANEPLTAWVAIVFFVGALTAGYIRLATTTAEHDTSHTLAVVVLFFFLVFAVYITGHVGNFKRTAEVIQAIGDLNRVYKDLFPEPQSLPRTGAANQDPQRSHLQDFDRRYREMMAYAGVNNSWRPQKHLEPRNPTAERRQYHLLFQSVFVVLISWTGAFLLSFFTPARGLGCRSGSWTLITLAWLVSALFDFAVRCAVLGFSQKSPKPLTQWKAKVMWRITIVKDLLLVICILILIIMSQIGWFNTCWCMASLVFRPKDKIKDACIDLGPLERGEKNSAWILWLVIPIATLLIIHFVIFWAGYEGEGGRLLYLRTETEKIAEETALNNMRKLLKIDENSSSDDIHRQNPHIASYNNDESEPWQAQRQPTVAFAEMPSGSPSPSPSPARYGGRFEDDPIHLDALPSDQSAATSSTLLRPLQRRDTRTRSQDSDGSSHLTPSSITPSLEATGRTPLLSSSRS